MVRTLATVGAKLDIGRQRSDNEDSLGYRQAENDDEARRFGDLFVLADGMGGHAAGEVASRLAVQTILSVFYSSQSPDIATALAGAVSAANKSIFEQASENPDLRGMGTTCVASAIHEDRLYTAHVGDSRAYLLRCDSLVQITEDHSWVEEQVRHGLLTAEEARTHPMRNVITRALGTAEDVRVDLSVRQIQANDILMICSDGLTVAVEYDVIRQILTTEMQPQAAVEALVDKANDAGGPDNIGVIAVRIERIASFSGNHVDESSPAPRRRKGWSRFLPFS